MYVRLLLHAAVVQDLRPYNKFDASLPVRGEVRPGFSSADWIALICREGLGLGA